jgi:hypothetical protein
MPQTNPKHRSTHTAIADKWSPLIVPETMIFGIIVVT